MKSNDLLAFELSCIQEDIHRLRLEMQYRFISLVALITIDVIILIIVIART